MEDNGKDKEDKDEELALVVEAAWVQSASAGDTVTLIPSMDIN